MSTEKVVRWDVCSTEVTPCKVEFELCPTPNGRYIEYTDVAGLVESVAKTIREFERMGSACGAVSILKQRTACENAMVEMKDALARFQQ